MANVRPGFPQAGGRGRPSFPEYEHKEAVSALSQSQNNFARDMYIKLAKESSGNLFFSPFSIMAALGMTLGGARGNTKAEMQKVLHLNDDDSVHEGFQDIIADIKKVVPDYELKTANMVYISHQLKVLEEFAGMLTKKYQSSSEVVDFGQSEAVRTKINDAVEKETNSRIKDLIPSGVLDALTRMVLVNAVYFKGLWQNQFNESHTRDGDFWTSADESVKVPMMHIKKKFGYAINRELGATMLRMGYQGSRLSMVIVLPDERDGLAAVEAKLANANFSELDQKMREVEVEVTLPRFKLEESLNLEEHLSAMGMVDAFSDKDADLSGISGTRDLYISKVIHKAFLEVNEAGSEAAAATGMVANTRALIRPLPPFVADHPFMFYIRDSHSGLMYFTGRLNSLS